MRMSDGSSDLCSSDLLAHELHSAANGVSLNNDTIFRAVAAVHKRVRGAYAVVAQISGYGLLAFRDPHGIRPLCIGRQETDEGVEWMVASESVALEGRSEEHTSELQSLMRISYAVFCLKKTIHTRHPIIHYYFVCFNNTHK